MSKRDFTVLGVHAPAPRPTLLAAFGVALGLSAIFLLVLALLSIWL